MDHRLYVAKQQAQLGWWRKGVDVDVILSSQPLTATEGCIRLHSSHWKHGWFDSLRCLFSVLYFHNSHVYCIHRMEILDVIFSCHLTNIVQPLNCTNIALDRLCLAVCTFLWTNHMCIWSNTLVTLEDFFSHKIRYKDEAASNWIMLYFCFKHVTECCCVALTTQAK